MNKRIALIGNNKGMEILCDFFCVQTGICVVALIHSDKEGSRETAQKYADEHGIVRLYHPKRGSTEEYRVFLNRLSDLKPDIAVCYSYDRIFDEAFLSIFNGEVYNLHGALLPTYRGQNVLNWVLVNGETRTGMTLHRMDLGVDSGPIVYQKEIEIDIKDTAVSLKEKMDRAVTQILKMFLPDILSGSIHVYQQDENMATYYHKRYPTDGEIDWNKPAKEIYNLIRALVAPWPGAFYYKDGNKYVIDHYMEYEDVIRMQKEMTP